MLKEFIEPLGLSKKSVAVHIGIPVQQINELIEGGRDMSPGTAWLLSRAFNTFSEFWLHLQTTHDLSLHKLQHCVQPLTATSL